jgi:hypothetical protein
VDDPVPPAGRVREPEPSEEHAVLTSNSAETSAATVMLIGL